MKDYIALWLEGLPGRLEELPGLRSKALDLSVSVTGIYDRHLGPTWPYAAITLRVEPASSFEVVNDIPEDEEFQKEGYLDWAIFGLLDVLMFVEGSPMHEIRVTLEGAEYSRVDSSQMAFHQAGRDAGRRVIESLMEKRRLAMRDRPEIKATTVRLSK